MAFFPANAARVTTAFVCTQLTRKTLLIVTGQIEGHTDEGSGQLIFIERKLVCKFEGTITIRSCFFSYFWAPLVIFPSALHMSDTQASAQCTWSSQIMLAVSQRGRDEAMPGSMKVYLLLLLRDARSSYRH